MKIRQEQPADYHAVKEVVRLAFQYADHADGDEHNLVTRLRKSAAFVPELSLVAEQDKQIVGHCLFTKISLQGCKTPVQLLALAPVSVLPKQQAKGIGGALIGEGFAIATALGYGGIIVLGHPDYYPRFGFLPAANFGIEAPFDVPPACFMAYALYPGALHGTGGVVAYDGAFFETDLCV